MQAQVFVDVNLRPPWCNDAEVLRQLRGAHWVKLNGNELDRLAPRPGGREQRAEELLEKHDLHGLLMTDGSRGATLLTADGLRRTTKPRTGIEVADTVGAGDAMTSVMLLGLLKGWDLQSSLDRAQEFASAIVGRQGATVADPAFYEPFLRAWSDHSAS
jgi:fructokinase